MPPFFFLALYVLYSEHWQGLILLFESMKWQVTPATTFIVVLVALFPCLIKAWRNPQPQMVTRWIAYAYTCGFLFGWHVHEKASLHFVIPLALVAVQSLEDARHYFVLSIGMLLPASVIPSDLISK